MERRPIRPTPPYSVFRRPSQRKPIYYARFRDPDTGQRRSAISTGCTRRDDAVRWCERYLTQTARATAEAKEKTEHITLGEYARDFWNIDSTYAQSRMAHLYSCSRGYLDIAESNTRNHILPVWGGCRLKDLTPGKIDAWVIRLCREGTISPATVNKLLQTLRTILGRAVADGWITENPAAFVKPVRAQGVERGILTPEEVCRLLGDSSIWDDFRHYTINLLAVTTGMRMGEIRGLCVENVKPDHIDVRHSWEQGYGLKPPKFNSIREVPISDRVRAALSRVIAETKPNTILFYCGSRKDTPISKNWIEKNLYGALRLIGILEVERKQRCITFHSHRHFLNTLLLSKGVPEAKVREITGHRSLKMSQHYTHFRAADFEEVVNIQSRLLKMPSSAEQFESPSEISTQLQ